MRRSHHAIASAAEVAGLYLAVTASGVALLAGWARVCETHKRGHSAA